MSHTPGNLPCSGSCNMMLWLQVASTWTIVQEQGPWMHGQSFWPMTSTCCSWCVPVLKVTGLVWLQRCGKAGGQRRWTLVKSYHFDFFYQYRHVVFTCVCCNCCKFITPLVLMLQTKEALQKVCGCFLACVHQFKSTVSDAFFSSAIDDIRKARLAIIQVGEWNWMRPKTFQLSVWWC